MNSSLEVDWGCGLTWAQVGEAGGDVDLLQGFQGLNVEQVDGGAL